MRVRSLVLVLVFPLLFAPAVSAGDGVLVDIGGLAPRELAFAGFELDGRRTVAIEALGFRHRSEQNDLQLSSAWILDAASRQVVWTLRDARSDKESKKLRRYTDRVELPKGRYEVYFATFPMWRDEGVDFEFGALRDVLSEIMDQWFDRRFDYGDYEDAVGDFKIVITGEGRPLGERDVRGYHESLNRGALFASTGLGGEHYQSVALTLDRAMDLQIYAIGEAGRDANYDHSWIVDTKTRKKVWQLDYDDSTPAGGARKNRMFKDTVSLPAGSYAVFCATDDSHHFDGWNAAPPYDPFFWGLTIQAADPTLAKHARVSDYDHIDEKKIVVEIIGLRDEEHMGTGFTLKKKMKLRIYAIGEGGRRGMYDYSWIVDADTRETVWEMEYRRTDHAGGAAKNRVIDEIIELDKGDYILYATSDDSHSYRRWNASPPYDKTRWGVTIFVEEGSVRDVAKFDDAGKSVIIRLVRIGNNENRRERFTLPRKSDVRVYALGEGRRGDMFDFAWIENAETGRVVWEMTYRNTEHAGGARKNRVFNDVISLPAGEYIVHYESDGSHSFDRWNASPPMDMINWGVTLKMAEAK